MVAGIDFLKTYSQFMQLQSRDTQNNPVNTSLASDSFTKQPEKPLDNKVYNDINDVKDTFESFTHRAEEINVRVNQLDDRVLKDKEATKEVFAALSPIIPFRRVSSVPDKIENKDYIGTAGLVALAGVMLPEDLRDMGDAVRQILNKVLPQSIKEKIKNRSPKLFNMFVNHDPKYSYKEFQTPFSFIRGSLLEKPVNKMGKLGYYIHKWDKPLINTWLGKKIQALLKVKPVGEREFSGRMVPQIKENAGKFEVKNKAVYAVKLEGSRIGKLICRALQRTTLYGTMSLFAICIPSIVKAFNKPDNVKNKLINGGKQTVKSAISVISVLSGIGICGALMAPLGPVGSVIGMGIGSVIGAYLSNRVNKNIKTDS